MLDCYFDEPSHEMVCQFFARLQQQTDLQMTSDHWESTALWLVRIHDVAGIELLLDSWPQEQPVCPHAIASMFFLVHPDRWDWRESTLPLMKVLLPHAGSARVIELYKERIALFEAEMEAERRRRRATRRRQRTND